MTQTGSDSNVAITASTDNFTTTSSSSSTQQCVNQSNHLHLPSDEITNQSGHDHSQDDQEDSDITMDEFTEDPPPNNPTVSDNVSQVHLNLEALTTQ